MAVIKLLDVREVLKAAGFDEASIAAAMADGLSLKGYWSLYVYVAEENDGLDSSKFMKSVQKYVDDDEKRANFLIMLAAIVQASRQKEYSQVLTGSIVECKPAYSFKYHGGKWTLLELKRGKKDRIYFYAAHFSGRPCIVLMLAHHKKDQTTPREVVNYCEPVMKLLVGPNCNVTIK